jgi:hypothetical protein
MGDGVSQRLNDSSGFRDTRRELADDRKNARLVHRFKYEDGTKPPVT